MIEPEDVQAARPDTHRPHTIHCGPDGIYGSALGSASGDGPGGIFVMDQDSFELKGKWELDRGPQQLAYDFWWHLGYDTMITSEWGTPNMVKKGVNPELLLAGKYGHKIHVWDLHKRRHLQEARPGCGATDGAGVAALSRSQSRLTVSSAWAFRLKIFRRRSGCGIARTAVRMANGPSVR